MRSMSLLAILCSLGSTPAWAQPTEAQPSPQPSPENTDIEALALELRDPFKRPGVVAVSEAAPVSDLEAYSVDQFKMVGAITGTGRVRAILLDPSGKTHLVSEKSRIGLRKGIIREIRANVVKVREKILNAIGREEAVDTDIRLVAESKPN